MYALYASLSYYTCENHGECRRKLQLARAAGFRCKALVGESGDAAKLSQASTKYMTDLLAKCAWTEWTH